MFNPFKRKEEIQPTENHTINQQLKANLGAIMVGENERLLEKQRAIIRKHNDDVFDNNRGKLVAEVLNTHMSPELRHIFSYVWSEGAGLSLKKIINVFDDDKRYTEFEDCNHLLAFDKDWDWSRYVKDD